MAKTQNERILDYLRVNGSITNMECFEKLKITRLSGRILELRRMGYDISMEWETAQDGSRYGRYHLEGGRDDKDHS